MFLLLYQRLAYLIMSFSAAYTSFSRYLHEAVTERNMISKTESALSTKSLSTVSGASSDRDKIRSEFSIVLAVVYGHISQNSM